jgi:hypothetical protein
MSPADFIILPHVARVIDAKGMRTQVYINKKKIL